MDTPHTHAAAIDRIGTKAIMQHFDITRQAVSHWRRNGVPRQYLRPMVLLGESLGKPVPEVNPDVKQAKFRA